LDSSETDVKGVPQIGIEKVRDDRLRRVCTLSWCVRQNSRCKKP